MSDAVEIRSFPPRLCEESPRRAKSLGAACARRAFACAVVDSGRKETGLWIGPAPSTKMIHCTQSAMGPAWTDES